MTRLKSSLGHLSAIITLLISFAALSNDPDTGKKAMAQHLLLPDIPAKYEGPEFETFKASHPVLQHYTHNPGWMKDRFNEVQKWIKDIDRKTLEDIVPEQMQGLKCCCPKCGKDKWSFDPKQPALLKCDACKTSLPNETYPENANYVLRGWFNAKVSVPYHKAVNGKQYCFRGALNGLKAKYVRDWQFKLAVAAQLKNTPEVATRTRDLLFILAKKAHGFLPGKWKHDREYENLIVWPADRDPDGVQIRLLPHYHSNSRMDTYTNFICWGLSRQQEDILGFGNLYDLTYSSDVYDENVTLHGQTRSYRQFIDEKFFGLMAGYMKGVTELFGREPHAYGSTGNILKQYLWALRDARVTGRVDHMKPIIDQALTHAFDSWRVSLDYHTIEGSGYQYCWLGGYYQPIKEFLQMEYPAGIKPVQQEILRNAAYKRIMEVTRRVTWPDGLWPSMNDGGGGKTIATIPRKASYNELLPGLGYGVLGNGEDDAQIQAHLDFTNNGNHAHKDSLTATFYAFGTPLLTDLGTYYGFFGLSHSTPMHNTVTIDERTQHGKYGNSGGDIVLFKEFPGLSVIRANNSENAYGNVNHRYVRTLALNTVDGDHPYLLDIFEVKGGAQHDFMLHTGQGDNYKKNNRKGDYQTTMHAKASIPLRKMAGKNPLDPKRKKNYWTFCNVSKGQMAGKGHVDFINDDPNGACLRSHFGAQSGMELYLGENPVLPYFWIHGHDGKKALKDFLESDKVPYSAKAMLRRKGEPGKELSSIFVVVHEPRKKRNSTSTILDLTWKNMGHHLAVVVKTKGRTDTYFMRKDYWQHTRDPRDARYADITTDSVFSMVSVTGNQTDHWMIGGTYLKSKHGEVKRKHREERGRILATFSKRAGDAGNAILTSAPLPLGTELRGQWILCEFFSHAISREWTTAFWVDRVEKVGLNRKVYVREDPRLVMLPNGMREWYFPHRSAAYADVTLPSSACSVPVLRMEQRRVGMDSIPDQEAIAFDKEQAVSFVSSHPEFPIAVTTDGSLPTAANRIDGHAIKLQKTGIVRGKVLRTGGVMESPVTLPQRFVGRLQAINETALKAGIKRIHHNRGVASHDVSSLNVKDGKTSIVETIKLPPMRRGHGCRFEGHIKVPKTGIYTFTSDAYPSSVLYIDDENIVNGFGPNDGYGQRAWPVRTGRIALEAGYHRLRVDFWTYTCFAGYLKVLWQGPGFEEQEIPGEVLFHEE